MAGAEARHDGKPRIVFLGPPNAGKGTQAAKLAASVEIPAISTGEMLRQAVADGSDLGRRVEQIMADGQLVSDELMAELVEARLARADASAGFLLDGYPRTRGQAETLEQILVERNDTLDHVVVLDCPDNVLIRRALDRGRVDDSEEIVEERLRVYREQTEPLIAYYDAKGLVRRIDGNRSIGEVAESILAAVKGDGVQGQA